MNNKGVTLIELLAAIMIMGIVSLIATISITYAINNSRDKQLKIIRTAISSAVDNYRLYNSAETTINLSSLTSGNLENNYLDPIDYKNEKCAIDSASGYVNIIERELYTTELGQYIKEEYCIYFVCNGTIIINDANDIQYCR